MKYPTGSVVVRVPRAEVPFVFARNPVYDEESEPYRRVKNYNLVIVPAGAVKSSLAQYNRYNYDFVYSAKSNRMYPWEEYYPDHNADSLDVGGPLVLVECVPAKDHHNPPKSVNLYASTAGVVWLALRACEPGQWAVGPSAARLVELDDAPFATYFDLIEELPGTPESRDRLRAKLNLFFGLTPVET